MKRVKNAVSSRIPKAISLGIRCITDEDARDRAVVDFRVMCRNEHVSATTDFTEMRERRKFTMPKLIRSFTIIRSSARKVSEVCRSGTKFIPHVGRSVTGESHCSGLIH